MNRCVIMTFAMAKGGCEYGRGRRTAPVPAGGSPYPRPSRLSAFFFVL